MIIASILVVSFAGLVQIVPLFFQHSTTQPVAGVEPYSRCRLMGRDVYIREGCVELPLAAGRVLAAEVQRYSPSRWPRSPCFTTIPSCGVPSRTGPDLARVERATPTSIASCSPRLVVPESNMPAYPWLERR
ncbi:cbb3-type cytochrome c oxidase subunit II [Achromobacter xylosoxidans]